MTAEGPCAGELLEIVPWIASGGRALVVGQAHRLLAQGDPGRWSKGQRHALLLLALSYQMARRLLEDLALEPAPLGPRTWRWKLCPGSEKIPASTLLWSGIGSGQVKPLPRTHGFMAELPETLVQQVLAWAPPVVAPADRSGNCLVMADHVSALLARHRLPGQRIRVVRTRYATGVPRAIPEICQALVHALGPVFTAQERRIAEFAPDEAHARLLTGYSRAQYYRLKGGARG